MKRDRQAVIKQLISRDKIGTQEEIKQRDWPLEAS